MNTYKVTRYIKEVGMSVTTIVTSDLSVDEFTKVANKAPKGLKRPLSKVTAVVPV